MDAFLFNLADFKESVRDGIQGYIVAGSGYIVLVK